MKLVFHSSYGNSTPPAYLRNRGDITRPFTLVLEDIPTRDQVLAMIPILMNDKAGTAITFNAGASVVHPKDQFNRKEGLSRRGANFQMNSFRFATLLQKMGMKSFLVCLEQTIKSGICP